MGFRSLVFLPLAAMSLLAVLLLAGVPAQAQIDSREGIALQNQILELRHDLELLQDQVARGGAVVRSAPAVSGSSSDLMAQLLSRVDALEQQVRDLRGRIDETTNQLQVQSADLSKQIGDLGFRVQNLEGGGGGRAPGAMSPPAGTLGTVPASPTAPAPAASASAAAAPKPAMRRTPEVALQEGNAALARRDYATAEAAARDVLTNNRTSPRAYDAQYLLAETLLGKRDYSQAAIAYDDAYRRSPKGVHAQESLLGLANSLTAINEKRAACDTLTQFRADFPSPRADLRDQIASVRVRAGCK